MTGIVQNNEHKLLAINGVEDHVHILVGLNPKQSMAELMKDVKGTSSKWINENKIRYTRFQWQEGYGAFSHSQDNIERVIQYIHNQEEHHAKKTFKKEYQQMLEKFEIDYDQQYAFHEPLD